MTIGIGVLCSVSGKTTDTLVFISDSMGSTETDSTNALGKMWSRKNVHGVGADNLVVAAEMFACIADQIEQLQPPVNHGSIWNAINRAVNGVRTEKFIWEVLRSEHVIENEHIGKVFVGEQSKIQEAWRAYHVGAYLLIGTFDHTGQAVLYYIGSFSNRPGWVHLCEFPGHMSIGSGSPNADMWLNHRNQALNMSVRRSLYHAYEASIMAASAPTVNREIEITIATYGDTSYFGSN